MQYGENKELVLNTFSLRFLQDHEVDISRPLDTQQSLQFRAGTICSQLDIAQVSTGKRRDPKSLPHLETKEMRS